MPFVSSVRGSYGGQSRKQAATKPNVSAITGGSITTSGGYRIHTFTSTGNSTFDMSGVEGLVDGNALSVEYLVVAGGGSGAGGHRTGTLSTPATSYTITVGGGSQDSTFSNITSTRGGGIGQPGGSGGGSARDSAGGQGSGIPGQGNPGGSSNQNGWWSGGGGGGAGSSGGNGNGPDQPGADNGGNGGSGTSNSITGSSVVRAAGAGGVYNSGQRGPAQPGPVTNTGSGPNGPGIVVLRYLT